MTSESTWWNIAQYVLVPFVVGPLCIGIKTYWEKLRQEKKEHQRQLVMEKREAIQKTLTTFYWGIYFRLLKNEELFNSLLKSIDRGSGSLQPIADPMDTMDKITESAIIIQRNFRKYLLKKQKKDTTNDRKNHHDVYIDINSSPKITGKRPLKEADENSDVSVDETNSDDGSGVFNSYFGESSNMELSRMNLIEIDKMILRNHKQIVSITEKYISLAQPKSHIMIELIKYMKFVTIYSAIRKSKDFTHVEDMGITHSRKLLILFREEVIRLQEEYNRLTKMLIDTA